MTNAELHTPTEPDDEINLLDLLLTIAENIKLLVLGPLAVGLLALGASFLITPTFTATTKFLPPQQQQSAAASLLASLGGLGGIAGAAAGIKNPNDQFVAFLQSTTLEDRLMDRFQLMKRYDEELKTDTRKKLEDNVRISAGKDGLITIDVDDHEPAFAAELANAYVDELRQLLGKLAVTEAQQRRLFFEKQLNQTKDNLTQAEQALQASGVNASALKSQPGAAVALVAQLQAQITAQEVKVASMRGYLTESAPDFKQALAELAALRAQLSKAESSSAGKQNDADYIARYRDFKYHETLFELLAKQYELARVDESREGAVIQVLDEALPPELKSKPKRGLIAVLATLATGFLLLMLVFVRSAWRNAKSHTETAQKMQAIRAHLHLKP